MAKRETTAAYLREMDRAQKIRDPLCHPERDYWNGYTRGMRQWLAGGEPPNRKPTSRRDESINAVRGEWDGYHWQEEELHKGPVRRGGTSNPGAGRPKTREGSKRRSVYLTDEEWAELQTRGGSSWLAEELGQ